MSLKEPDGKWAMFYFHSIEGRPWRRAFLVRLAVGLGHAYTEVVMERSAASDLADWLDRQVRWIYFEGGLGDQGDGGGA